MGRRPLSAATRERSGWWVTHVIESSGRTKVGVAAEMGYPYGTVKRWCNGRRCLDQEGMHRLCKVLGLDFYAERRRLFGYDEDT